MRLSSLSGMALQGGQGWTSADQATIDAMTGVDSGGQTVSATRFAELTGVSRDRLRTWERRHGFPEPVRVGSGPRRYALADAARVVSVLHAARPGTPLPEAIAAPRVAPAHAPASGDRARPPRLPAGATAAGRFSRGRRPASRACGARLGPRA